MKSYDHYESRLDSALKGRVKAAFIQSERPDRWLKEHFPSSTAGTEQSPCIDCHWRAEDRMIGSTLRRGCMLAFCAVYQQKPSEVLFDGADCIYRSTEDAPLPEAGVRAVVDRLREKYDFHS